MKPLLKAQGCALVLSDKPEEVAGWHYIKAVVKLTDVETGEGIDAAASAREPESKKGMDTSQVTGTASSYARKYALSGLFALDDTKDADTQDNRSSQPAPAKSSANPAAKTGESKPIYRCADCGKPFVEVCDQQGNVWSPQRQYAAAAKASADGKARCKACRGKQGVADGWN